MTLQFVLLLVPFLLGTSYMVVMISKQAAEQEARNQFNALGERALKAAKGPDGKLTPDWKEQLDRLADGSTFRTYKAGIFVRNQTTRQTWTASTNPPPVEIKLQPSDRPKSFYEMYRTSPNTLQDLRILVVAPRKPIDSNLLPYLLGLSLFTLAAVACGTWYMVGRVLSPIQLLSRQSSSASAEHLSVRLESPSKDAEMRDLVDTLNGLLDRVYETAEMKGRFYAAASHELRTPLQALSGHLELAASRKRTAEEYEAVVKESYTQARRLIGLVQGLLFLHQVDSRTLASPVQVNLTESIETTVEMLQSQIVTRRLTLNESLAPSVLISAVPSHADVLARNLIENAVKYGTEGGQIDVSLKADGRHVTLEVVNDFPEGVKIATENIFEPFYRDDTSRNSKTGGNGLGLAICRAISIANGWTVSASQSGGKIRAVVDFGAGSSRDDQKKPKLVGVA